MVIEGGRILQFSIEGQGVIVRYLCYFIYLVSTYSGAVEAMTAAPPRLAP